MDNYLCTPSWLMKIYYGNTLTYPEYDSAAALYTYYRYKHLEGIEPVSLHYFDFQTCDPITLNVQYTQHMYKMVLCYSGNAQTFLQSKLQYAYHTGKVLIYPVQPGTYTSELPGNKQFSILHLHLSGRLASMLPQILPQLRHTPQLEFPLPPASLDLLDLLQHTDMLIPSMKPLIAEKIVYDQLFALCRQRVAVDQEALMLQKACTLLEQSSSFMTIKELARDLTTNEWKVKKIFREHLQTSVHAYQVKLKLSRAYELLQYSGLPIYEVALRCGYESLGSFSNAFHQHYGIRPKEVRFSRLDK